MTEEQTEHHPEEPAEGSQEGVEKAPNEEEAPARTGDTTAPGNEKEEVSEEDDSPSAGPEASPGGCAGRQVREDFP